MVRYLSIRKQCESIGITSQKDVNRLKPAILAFTREHLAWDDTINSLHQIAQDFIHGQGKNYFSACDNEERILEAVVGIMKVQRRNRIDNEGRQPTQRGWMSQNCLSKEIELEDDGQSIAGSSSR